jgi:pyruvate dehydrogenase E1 component alpha subunit
MPAAEVDGRDVERVWQCAEGGVERARRDEGPTFIHARCAHLDGHFLGDQLVRIARHPVSGLAEMGGPLLQAAVGRKGAPVQGRVRSVGAILRLIGKTLRERSGEHNDPVALLRGALIRERERLAEVEAEVAAEVRKTVEAALDITPTGAA